MADLPGPDTLYGRRERWKDWAIVFVAVSLHVNDDDSKPSTS
jgi:hypothetical protein